MAETAEKTRLIHYVELLLHAPFPTTEHHQLCPGETREQATKRFVRVYASELTAIVFYDRVELKTGGLTFLSNDLINMSKPLRFA